MSLPVILQEDHLFLSLGWPWVTGTVENITEDMKVLLLLRKGTQEVGIQLGS